MLAIPNTPTTATDTSSSAAVFPVEQGALTPYSSGYVFVANNAAQISVKRGPSSSEAQWSPYALVAPTMIPLSTDRGGRQRPDFIFGFKAIDGVSGTHAQVFGALFQPGEAGFVPSTQFLGNVTGSGGFTPPSSDLTGSIIPYGGSALPSGGYLFCDGTAVSRTTYAALFAVIATAYGVGDGVTTFNVPDLRGRAPVGYVPGGQAEVNALGNSEGSAAANRSPKHPSTVTDPTHAHGVTDPSHTHPMEINSDGSTSSGSNVGPNVITDHAPTGTVATDAAVTGLTVNANSTGITVGAGHPTAADTPAFLAINYLIKT